MNERPLVSVVIPTFNSAGTIERCLESIKKQTYRNIEIIVVDNFSTDNTREIAQQFADKVLTCGPERSAQVNHGVRASKGKYIYRVDADFVLSPTVIAEAVQKCELEGFDAVVIHNTSDPTVSFWAKVRKLERDCYKKDLHNVAARFMKKKVFQEIGGFDESLIACEDYDLHKRLVHAGFRIGIIDAEEIHIGEPKTLGEICRKHYYYGKTVREYVKKYGRQAIAELSPIRQSFLRNWRKFLTHPVLAVGFLLYQGTRYAAAMVGYCRSTIDEWIGRP
ncbi:MAG: glycosyl transferase [Deltaproteobacteria bacterium]|nr:MAG: glycosyl transferase [Deltaproteobacteria bacterium]